MFIACGAGAFYSAMFHLTSHAFIKALLFLSAGNVLHGVCGETEMEKMGGLSKVFPKTKWLFLIGSFALAGIPPFAGFFSKDLILEQEYLAGFEWQYSIGLVAAILTGVYLIRAYCLVFMGQYRGSQEVWKQAKEAPLIMLVPAAILAVLSTVGGLLGYTFGSMPLLEGFLHQLGLTEAEQELHSGFVITPGTIGVVAGSLFGIGLTAWIYTKMRESIGQPFRLFRKSFYVNELYDNLIVMPLKAVSSSIAFWVEPYAIGGMIKGPVWVAQASATVLQKMQSGQIRSYLAWIAIGSVFIMIYLYH
jgi:NADH-quinone oxidoreductase subunit L